ncbi:prolyl-tRNA synthetase associated domain-containing protein [Bacillus sp. ISL-40]|uniref:prolyl-tRNA synthetase associated domain-containing protein n=1 Tax=unclassified Bacillus (in: firmicutes) TaxID=185979 RepID=UPI001BE8F08C|nr:MULTISPECIES: prolyl-tRNA synthetase associated domain-containing protein [unclassified Bacillus (in: firmicutes)]MBT2701357.1 prolyl-tRNA synthetase associated domain-containing protein [Bacillus sp. ISL-40]MBT2719700.1 prolyl-tRNA synthetase associated domain-containing protein [Bacillus sp. ISL-46]MBT2742141.1 prolyl-tRNA synthetase associated domain-containing protein [Bacillus sp. ISL-77]
MILLEQEKSVYDVLEQLKISFKRYEHVPVFTVEEIRNLDITIPGGHTKNLFLRNRKGDKHFLMIVSEDKDVDLKSLSKLINSTPLSFGSPERLNKYLKVYPGAVGAFGLLNDTTNHVQVVLDSDLLDKDTINFHPNVNTATVNLSVQEFRRYLNSINNPVSILKFSSSQF